MRQLSADDATFLYSDTDHANANITLVLMYDPSGVLHGRLRYKDLLAHVAGRLHLAPMFRERLLRTPLDVDLPYWVDDDQFDLEYHVRHVALPDPGDWRQFCIQVSRIHARPLDQARPLWELYLVDRLDSIKGLPRHSFAILLKCHHSAMHGQEGSDIALLLHDLSPAAHPPGPPEPWFPASAPATTEVLLRAWHHNVSSPFLGSRPLARAMAHLTPRLIGLVADALRRPDDFPTARFNAEVSQHRVFETQTLEAAQVEQIQSLVSGATLDDVLLAICGGALRRYLEFHDELPAASLVALTPASIHGTAAGAGDWEAGLRRVTLATDLASPLARLRTIHDANKTSGEAEQDRGEHAPAAVLSLAARALSAAAPAAGRGITIANCIILNAPGPTQPLYLLGARLAYFSAVAPIADGLGLTLAVTTYDGRILISPTACREQLPDPEFLARCIRESFEEYHALSAKRRAPRVRATHRRRGAATRAAR